MRVAEQQNQTPDKSIIELMRQASKTEDAPSFADAVKAAGEDSLGIKSFHLKDATYLNPAKEEKKDLLEQIEEGTALDAAERKNQMAVLSHTVSEEDYMRMQEEGFSLDASATNTIVTAIDKIKVELAKAGVDVSCFGDDLSEEQLEAIAGNPELARQLIEAFREADLPLREETMQDMAKVFEMADALTAPSEGAVKYLLDNQLDPTLENLYMAEYSGSSGYQPAPAMDVSSFAPQIEMVIRTAGLEVSEDTLRTSRWMLEQEIPLTPENLSYAQALKTMELPIPAEKLAERAAAAVAEGAGLMDAMLLDGYTLAEQAQHALDVVQSAVMEDVAYVAEHGMEFTIRSLEQAAAVRETAQATGETEPLPAGEEAAAAVLREGEAGQEYTRSGLQLLTAWRQLEEVRLMMTAQANYSLLKQGISIDTQPLAALVEQLKELENSYYRNLLAAEQMESSDENVFLFKEITTRVTEIKYVPAYVLGAKEADVSTIAGIHEAGTALKDTFEKANERYETLMTAPRADLGDSIQKAFRNVDDILADMQMEISEENRRAVRILGYNSLEINQESVAEMKAADEEVQRMFKNMTPSVVMEMIRRGIKPLGMPLEELNHVAEDLKAGGISGGETEKYSEYLWKLEQNHAISEEERSSYIGIYRLMKQVENTDGAAIGALLNQGAELTMKNLLTAVRSEKRGGKMEYAVDDAFAGVERGNAESLSITEQIEIGYQNNCLKDVLDAMTPEKLRVMMQQRPDWENMTPEQLKAALEQTETDESQTDMAYAKERLAQLEQAAGAAKDIYHVLEKYDIPNTMANVLAMEMMIKDRNQMFRKIFGGAGKEADRSPGAEDAGEEKAKLLEAFGEALSDPEALSAAQEKLGELAEAAMTDRINREEVKSLDVREMRLLSAQLSVSRILAKEEQYCVPVMVDEELLNVSVKIVRGMDKKGSVDIMMESDRHGKIAAAFQAKEKGISGLVAVNSKETKETLETGLSVLAERLSGEGNAVSDLHFAHVADLDLNHFSMGAYGAEAGSGIPAERESESYKVQTSRLYRIAESFIKSIKETLG